MPVGGIRAGIVCRDKGSAEKLESRIDLKPRYTVSAVAAFRRTRRPTTGDRKCDDGCPL
jgi:hypothetical protein